MAQQKNDEPKYDFPAGLGQPALRALKKAGYTRLEQFTAIKESELSKLHGVGPKAIGMIREALNAKRQAFADSEAATASKKEQVFDSPIGWVKSHIREYENSDGKKGHLWRGLPTLLLTTRIFHSLSTPTQSSHLRPPASSIL